MTKVVALRTVQKKREIRPDAVKFAVSKIFKGTTAQLVQDLLPAEPLYVLWPKKLTAKARHFVDAFPGKPMYAVKTNPDKKVLKALAQGGIDTFDVASIAEVRLVRSILPQAVLYFMHPVKSPEAIRESYFVHGVRNFVLDCEEELEKIIRETGLARDLNLFVRMALPRNSSAGIDFSAKFGATPEEAVSLLQKCRIVSQKLGLSFHVGTQTTNPSVYGKAVRMAAEVLRKSGVSIDILNVGGGFAVPYPGEQVPELETTIGAIKTALKAEKLEHIPLMSEPGRYLVAQGGALITRVELRKGNRLYLNDGTYGGMFDAGPVLNVRFPVKAIRALGPFSSEMAEFQFAGPTCDSLDMMKGPFILPFDIKTGDWIEIGNMGAYSNTLRTDFNGFGNAHTVCLSDI